MTGSAALGRAIWKATRDTEFRRRFLQNAGMALAEDGFVLSDEEMGTVRGYSDELQGLSDRAAYERIAAIARLKYREVD